MKFTGWLSAAIEILETMEQRHQPVKHALSDWGRSHRFAGSKDRAAIGNLVYDIERKRASLAWLMQEQTPRSLVLAAAIHLWGETAESLNSLFQDDKFAPEKISEREQLTLTQNAEQSLSKAPVFIQADIPEWLEEAFKDQFDERVISEGLALSERAPIDIRVNTNKATIEKLKKSLARQSPENTTYSKLGLRIAPARGMKKTPNLEAEAAHGKGWFEIQDEGSQLASLMTGARAGDQLLDFCAGAGGKTLALSAMMANKGQIHAFDSDKQRLRPIFERLKRAGCRNVQTYEAGNNETLKPLLGGMDIVLLDAPCTGSGTWRRHPDAKWRLSEKSLKERLRQQKEVLHQGADFVKPGGRLVYVTCSVLREENESQIKTFLKAKKDFQPIPFQEQWKAINQPYDQINELKSANGEQTFLTLSPKSHGTDGFFIAILKKSA